jgi:hypothetical protein
MRSFSLRQAFNIVINAQREPKKAAITCQSCCQEPRKGSCQGRGDQPVQEWAHVEIWRRCKAHLYQKFIAPAVEVVKGLENVDVKNQNAAIGA